MWWATPRYCVAKRDAFGGCPPHCVAKRDAFGGRARGGGEFKVYHTFGGRARGGGDFEVGVVATLALRGGAAPQERVAVRGHLSAFNLLYIQYILYLIKKYICTQRYQIKPNLLHTCCMVLTT